MKNKTLDYIFGMITGIAISIAVAALTNNSLNAGNDGVLEVKVVNKSWDPVKVEIQQMGRVTEYIDFINRKKLPNSEEEIALYTHISITEKLKQTRKEHRKVINKESK